MRCAGKMWRLFYSSLSSQLQIRKIEMRALHARLKEEQQYHLNRTKLREEDVTVETRVQRMKDKVANNENKRLFAVMYTTIHKAACDGSTEGILHFLTSKENHVDDFDPRGLCPIHYAAERGHLDVVRLLIEKGCEVDVRSSDELTAAMFAAKGGQGHIIQYLHASGACDLMAVNRAGLSAAHYACQGNHRHVLEILLELHAYDKTYILENQSVVIQDKESPFKLLSKSGQTDKVPTRTPHDIILNRCICDGVYHALTISELLDLEAHVVVDVASNNGARPLHLAASVDSKSCVEFLLEAGVSPHSVDNNGETALHKAGRANHYETYRLLVSMGASEVAINALRETPLALLKDESHIY